jgi:ElaB/YqjD/DUF883 family membrane-anchored ribosome-binding protein
MKTAAEGPGESNDKAALEEQLARIKADITELASTLASIGSRRIHGARSGADGRIGDMTQSAEKALEDLREQLRTVERDVSAKVQEKPLQTLGVAAGIGFLLALIMRR